MIMVSLVLMNMLLAIMIDHYANVKQNVGSSITLFKQVGLEIKKIGGPKGLFALFVSVPKGALSMCLDWTGWFADKVENAQSKSGKKSAKTVPKAAEGDDDDDDENTKETPEDDDDVDVEAQTTYNDDPKCCGKFSEKLANIKATVDDSFQIKKTSDYHYDKEAQEEMWERLGYEIAPDEKLLDLISTNALKIKWKMKELRQGWRNLKSKFRALWGRANVCEAKKMS